MSTGNDYAFGSGQSVLFARLSELRQSRPNAHEHESKR